ncbi:MAG TPA: TraX family protein [Clostridia bacterium]|nr:TraX family protein [Clostridia bacterium]
MSSFILKILAMIFMICDHSAKSILTGATPLYLVGVCSFPIFAFQIVQGYINTSNLKNYIKRLFTFALVSQIPFMLFLSTFTNNIFRLNIFFTLILGLLALYFYSLKINNFLKFFIILFLIFIASYFRVDYGAWGVTLILMFYIFRENKILLGLLYVILCIIKYINILILHFNIFFFGLFAFTISALIAILLYNGKKGKHLPTFFYMFYPIHLLVIYLIHVIIN